MAGRPPALDLDYEKRLQQAVLMANQKKLLSSAHDVSDGGLAVAVLESAFGTGLGIDLDFTQELSVSAALFGESQSRIVVSVDPEKQQQRSFWVKLTFGWESYWTESWSSITKLSSSTAPEELKAV